MVYEVNFRVEVFVISVNVLFLSNSQRSCPHVAGSEGVCHKCQCPLFKQFTTSAKPPSTTPSVFVISVNVLFLSNSQQERIQGRPRYGVCHKCQCPLFKQFTTRQASKRRRSGVFVISVNVLFLSNSQPSVRCAALVSRCLS